MQTSSASLGSRKQPRAHGSVVSAPSVHLERDMPSAAHVKRVVESLGPQGADASAALESEGDVAASACVSVRASECASAKNKEALASRACPASLEPTACHPESDVGGDEHPTPTPTPSA